MFEVCHESANMRPGSKRYLDSDTSATAVRKAKSPFYSWLAVRTLSMGGYPSVPWREISGFRNILVHNYLGNIDPLTVAAVIKQHLQPLKSCVQTMLREAEDPS